VGSGVASTVVLIHLLRLKQTPRAICVIIRQQVKQEQANGRKSITGEHDLKQARPQEQQQEVRTTAKRRERIQGIQEGKQSEGKKPDTSHTTSVNKSKGVRLKPELTGGGGER